MKKMTRSNYIMCILLGLCLSGCVGSSTSHYKTELIRSEGYKVVQQNEERQIFLFGLPSADRTPLSFESTLWRRSDIGRVLILTPTGDEIHNEQFDEYLTQRLILSFIPIANDRYVCITYLTETTDLIPSEIDIIVLDNYQILATLPVRIRSSVSTLRVARQRENLLLLVTPENHTEEHPKTALLSSDLNIIHLDKTMFSFPRRENDLKK